MGKGAFVVIKNDTDETVSVSYNNFYHVYRNGEEGSDFTPISGAISPHTIIPADRNTLPGAYIEAVSSARTSTVDMELSWGTHKVVLRLREDYHKWWVENTTEKAGQLSIKALVSPHQDQYLIVVAISYTAQWQPATWMGDLEAQIKTKPINMVALPGTHDSASNCITAASGIAPSQDIPDWIDKLCKALPTSAAAFVGNPFGVATAGVLGLAAIAIMETIAKWSKAQHLTVQEQLERGIRYLDLRVVRYNSDYYTCHGMYSCNLDDVIREIKTFVDAHPKEIVILDFNHLYEIVTDAEHQALITKLTGAFGNKMAPNTIGPTATVETFWRSGYQVIALYGDRRIVADPNTNPGQMLWSQRDISSPWQPETNNIPDVKNKIGTFLKNRSSTSFFVLQGIVNPDDNVRTDGAFKPGYPNSLAALAEHVTPAVCGWLVNDWRNEKHNIVIVDWFDTIGQTYVDVVVELNF